MRSLELKGSLHYKPTNYFLKYGIFLEILCVVRKPTSFLCTGVFFVCLNFLKKKKQCRKFKFYFFKRNKVCIIVTSKLKLTEGSFLSFP